MIMCSNIATTSTPSCAAIYCYLLTRTRCRSAAASDYDAAFMAREPARDDGRALEEQDAHAPARGDVGSISARRNTSRQREHAPVESGVPCVTSGCGTTLHSPLRMCLPALPETGAHVAHSMCIRYGV